MRPIYQTILVTYRYPVHFTNNLFVRESTLLKDVVEANEGQWPRKILCILDRGVARYHPGLLASVDAYCQYYQSSLSLVCAPLLMDGGESAKNDPANQALVQEAIYRFGICRQSYVMVIGGGAVIDAVGYAAATAHRGVRLIRVPTTVLAQSDSAVGVKNGVNAFGRKNFLGTFAPPAAVLNDEQFLTTLSMRDWRAGISEAMKVALLKDATFFDFLEERAGRLVDRDMESMRKLIHRCAQLHLDHIATSGDPFEFGSSRPLDFGHWAAHRLESLSRYMLRHGEAVAIGIALDTTYSYLAGLLSKQEWQRILALLSVLGLPIYIHELSAHLHDSGHEEHILAGLHEFREHLGGQLTITLLAGIGRGIEVHAIDEAMMKRSIVLLEQYQYKEKEL